MTRPAAPPIARRCARILIADDDPRMRELLSGLPEADARHGWWDPEIVRAFEQVANGRRKG